MHLVIATGDRPQINGFAVAKRRWDRILANNNNKNPSVILKNFPHFVVIHTVKGFRVVNEAEVDIFQEFSCFFYDPTDAANVISSPSAYVLLKPHLENSEHYFASM